MLTPQKVKVLAVTLSDGTEAFTVAGHLHLSQEEAERAATRVRKSLREREKLYKLALDLRVDLDQDGGNDNE